MGEYPKGVQKARPLQPAHALKRLWEEFDTLMALENSEDAQNGAISRASSFALASYQPPQKTQGYYDKKPHKYPALFFLFL